MNDMSILDWERQFRKYNNGKTKFPVNQAIFIKALGRFGPIDSKPELKKKIIEAGLTEAEYDEVYEDLKRMHIMKYNVGEPRGWYIEPSALDRVNTEYPEQIIKKESENTDSLKKKTTKNSTIDVFIEPKKEESNKFEPDNNLTENISSENEDFDDISPEELKKIMREWEKENLT